jgi:hypothetical protein
VLKQILENKLDLHHHHNINHHHFEHFLNKIIMKVLHYLMV